MSILHPDSIGKVRKILRFEAVFHDSASDCTKLTLAQVKLTFLVIKVESGSGSILVLQVLQSYEGMPGNRFGSG
jgi:hypothetical protein